jgi:hypothetical protein
MPKIIQMHASVKLLLFMAGFGILAIEILGHRILSPYVGTTLPVWGAIIGVALIGGAVGYYVGGHLADRAVLSKGYLFSLSAGAGIFLALIPFLRDILTHSSLSEALSIQNLALFGSFLLFFVPVLLLSAITTYVIRFHVDALTTVGQVHGDLYALVTLGSIAGVFGTSYLLIPFLSVPHILYATAAVIALSGFAVATYTNIR